jgi:type IV pilus assembly protein PilC
MGRPGTIRANIRYGGAVFMVSRGRLAQTYSDLATLLEAGVPILRSFDILVEGRKGSPRRVLAQMRDGLSQGSTLGESMSRHQRVFPDIDRMLIEASETAGSLPDSLNMLSYWHEFIHRLKWRMVAALAYPLFILHAAAFIFPLPSLILSFLNGQAGLGQCLVQYLGGVFGILVWLYVPILLIWASVHFKELRPLRHALDRLVLRVPLLGRAVYNLSISRYARAFAMLYKAGVPISECTEKATPAAGNVVVAELFAGAATSVRNGGTAGAGLSRQLPPEYRDLWMIGEETGQLDKTATKISEMAADRADFFFVQFGSWLPKIIYFIIMGIMAYMIFMLAQQVYGSLYRF